MCRWNSENRIIILYVWYIFMCGVCIGHRVPIWTTQDETAPTKWVVHARRTIAAAAAVYIVCICCVNC